MDNKGVLRLQEMDISPEVIDAFEYMGFTELTAIQDKCIPLMRGESGKLLALEFQCWNMLA